MDMGSLTIDFFFAKEEISQVPDGCPVTKSLPFFSIAQSLAGRYGISIDGSPMQYTQPGGCFLAPAGAHQEIIHLNDPIQNQNRYRFLFFTILTDQYVDITRYLKPPVIVGGDAARSLGDNIGNIIRLQDQFDYMSTAKRHKYLFDILCTLMEISEAQPVEFLYAPLLPALEYINKHYTGHIPTETLAKCCNFSVSYFYSLFREALHTTPGKYILNKRLDAACALLMTTRKSIAAIAEMLGFSDQFHFSREFKRLFGLSPLKYRRQYDCPAAKPFPEVSE